MSSADKYKNGHYNAAYDQGSMEAHRDVSSRVQPGPLSSGTAVDLSRPIVEMQYMLGAEEKLLLRLAEEDDLEQLKLHVENISDVDMNATDHQGRTALQLAVRNHNQVMVKYLLQQCPAIHLGDSLLFAVRENSMAIIEILLDHQSKSQPDPLHEAPVMSAEFPAHMTPLMLACLENKHEVIQLLLVRGHRIQVPEDDINTPSAQTDSVQLSRARLDSYRALCSPAYLGISSEDPILSAFTLSHEAEVRAKIDPLFKEDYQAISSQCRRFATDLLDQCHTSDEVWLLLRQDHCPKQVPAVTPGGRFPRLRLALQYEQKEFITHRSCQQVLQALWTQYNSQVMWHTYTQHLLYFIPRVLILPFVYVAYFFFPCAKCFHYWEAPMIKFAGDTVSYIVFLALLLTNIIRDTESQAGQRVPDLGNGVDVAIWVFVASYIWEIIKMGYHGGIRSFTKSKWNAYLAAMCFFFVISFIGRLASYIRSHHVFDTGYENEPRFLWPWDDPMLVSEAFFSLGVVFAFGRILYFFQISQILGPMQLTLSCMMFNTLQLLAIFFVVLIAFASGMTRLYVYYNDMVRIDEDDDIQEQSDSFTSWQASFKTLFWGLFGYGQFSNADIVVDNRCPGDNSSMACHEARSHRFTEGMGHILYASYHVVAVIILINMLIAMMSYSYKQIQQNADIEWQFCRSELWFEYLENKSVLPCPVNLLPSVKSLMDLARWCSARSARAQGQQAAFSTRQCCFIETQVELKARESNNKAYKVILTRLVQRYLSKLDKEARMTRTRMTYENLEQIKLDILKELRRANDIHGQ